MLVERGTAPGVAVALGEQPNDALSIDARFAGIAHDPPYREMHGVLSADFGESDQEAWALAGIGQRTRVEAPATTDR